jgi:NADH-quinone oxidoreductase subunit L
MEANLIIGLILLLPLAGAVFNGIVGLFVPAIRKEGLIGTVGTAVVAIPFLLALYLFFTYDGNPIVVNFYTWMAAGDLSLSFGYRIDELSLIMALVVTGVGAVIHLYSIGYMHGDRGFWRYFAFINLFIFAMLNLILGNNMVVLFLGWEGVGLCSYLLIGFWYEDFKNSLAANKAFIVNRVGDFAFLLAMFLTFRELGGLDFDTILSGAPGLSQATVNWIVLLLFIGATGKSAQIPLFVWLPDAMAGPTPVSALIHAATMVTSGLYLLARLSPVVLAAPGIMVVIAIVATLTAFMAATIAITQNDIKKVLAYSTVSQLGFMFMAAGVGAFAVSIFHLVTHAFFKACLFLGSGSVIHAMHGVEHALEHEGHKGGEHFNPQDMRTMGGLKKYMPATSLTFLIATLAIAGIPPLSGYLSKDEILFRAFEYGYDGNTYAWLVWGLGLITAFLTAFYMSRAYVLTFLGKERWPHADRIHPHESPATMTIPLYVLAFLSVVGGLIGIPAVFAHGEWNWITHWLTAPEGGPVAVPEIAPHEPGFVTIEIVLLLVGALIAIVGVYFGMTAYRKHGLAFDEKLRAAFGGWYRLSEAKYYWDELYDRIAVKPVVEGSYQGLAPFDQRIVDGAVNGVARLTRALAGTFRQIQTGFVQNYALSIAFGVALVLALILFA